jgi:tetratricopeptide (TPR) repeat protein
VAAAAGRDVGYPLLRTVAALPEPQVRESLRQAVEHGVLVAEQATGSFRFRHALLAEAVYATLLPGEREELHARLAQELARSGAASPAERQAQAVFGLAEAFAHLERALALWPVVPDAVDLVKVDLAELCSWAAELAWQTGAVPRAVELVPAQPPSPERAQALAALAHGLMLAWRHDESMVVCEQALALALTVGAHSAQVRALTVLGTDLAYLGRGDQGLARLRQALRHAEEHGDPMVLQRVYVMLTDVLTMLGRPRESARLAAAGLELLAQRARLELASPAPGRPTGSKASRRSSASRRARRRS